MKIEFGIMKIEFEIPNDLKSEMDQYSEIDWNHIVSQAIQGFLHDFSILDKLKDFWGTERKKS